MRFAIWLYTLVLALAVHAAPTAPASGINTIQSLEESASPFQRRQGMEVSNGELIKANTNKPTEAKFTVLPRGVTPEAKKFWGNFRKGWKATWKKYYEGNWCTGKASTLTHFPRKSIDKRTRITLP